MTQRRGSEARTIHRKRWARALVRAATILLFSLFAAQSSIAFAFPCADACTEQSCPDDEHGCGCPVECAKGCCGPTGRAVPQAPALPELVPPFVIALRAWLLPQAPAAVEPAGVLHVPRPLSV